MGRHVNVNSFYSYQTYVRIPKQLLRGNANLLVFFRQDETNPKHVYEGHENNDMTYAKFRD